MITTRAFMNQTWTDLNSPTKEEVDSLVLTSNISPIIAKDLVTPTPVQFVEEDGDIIYVVLHIPTFKHSHSAENIQEVDFIISANSVVTARYDSIDALHYFAKKVEVNEILNRGKDSHLFFGIMKEIYKEMSDELSYMEGWMEEIEKNIFEGQEKAMVSAISNAGRNILNFKRIIEPHSNIFEFVKEAGREKFGDVFGAEAKTLVEEWRHIIKRIDNHKDLLDELRETNNSLLSTKQNEIMKDLAVIGLILLPLTLIGQIFGLSIKTFPLIGHPYAFWVVLGLMFVVMSISLLFAKLKKWI